VHSARQDIEVIYQAAGSMPGKLFDTQVAAALLGYQPQIGYAGLVKELFDVELPKSHTRANWSRRPLPDEYLEYAAEDVEYLLPACDILTERLEQKGRLEWALYDSALLLEPALYEIDPANAVQRLKGARNFAGSRRAAAARLAEWRETEALKRNLPRQWIIKDTVLTDIAYKLPANMNELGTIDSLPAKVAERAGPDILAAVRAAKTESGDGYRPPGRPDEAQKKLLQDMQKLVGDCASELELPAETIASKKELAGLLDGERSDSRVFNGWRGELVGKRLAALF
jgi:ribonuclease D